MLFFPSQKRTSSSSSAASSSRSTVRRGKNGGGRKNSRRKIKEQPRKKALFLKSYGRDSQGKRLGIGETLHRVRKNASARTNQRLGMRPRMTSKQVTLYGNTADLVDEYQGLGVLSRVGRWFLAMLLLPVCLIATLTLIQGVGETKVSSSFFHSNSFLCFVLGVCSMVSCFWFCQRYSQHHALIHWLERQILLLYVLGHELTHALFVYLSFGWVSKIKCTVNGGYIITNKSNLLISLSPYFIPFWSLVSLSIMMGVQHVYPFDYFDIVMIALLGMTWTFHLYWTVWMIPRDQPDLQENGTFFSLVVIYLANILLLSMMVSWASQKVSIQTFIAGWQENGRRVLAPLLDWVQYIFP